MSGAVILFIVRPGSTVVATEDMGNPKMGDIVVYLGRTPRIDELPRADRDVEDEKARRRAKVHTLRESMSTSSAEEQVRERANARADAEGRPQSGKDGQHVRDVSSQPGSGDVIPGTVVPGDPDQPDARSSDH